MGGHQHVCRSRVIKQRACGAHLGCPIVARHAGADGLAMVKGCHLPVRINVAAGTKIGSVQMGRIFRRDDLHRRLGRAVVAAIASTSGLGVIHHFGWCPRYAANGMAGIAGAGGWNVRCRLERNGAAREAQLNTAGMTADARTGHLCVVNLRRRHIPVGRGFVAGIASLAGSDMRC